MNVMDKMEAITQISTEATQEAALEELLGKVSGMWTKTEFTVLPHKSPSRFG